MTVEFIDLELDSNPRNGSRISQGEEMLKLLGELRSREPFFFELRSENKCTLTVGIGESFGSVQFSPSNGDTPYLLAVAPGSPAMLPGGNNNPYASACEADTEAGVTAPEFMCGGTATPVPTRYCVPFDVMKKIVVHFVETEDRVPDVLWEEI